MALSKAKTKLIHRLLSPRQRGREGQFLVEGVRAAMSVLGGRLAPEIRFAVVAPRVEETSRGLDLVARLEAAGVPVDEASNEEMKELSGTEQPQGILLVVQEPVSPAEGLKGGPHGRLLLLDGVQDPGNVGTLVRAADAFGLDAVIALEGTVDPFNAKAVRASAGALANIPVFPRPWGTVKEHLRTWGVPLLVADVQGMSIRRAPRYPTWALVVGNEGAGARKEVRDEARALLRVPMRENVDSLNAGVAGAVLLFALTGVSGDEDMEA